MPRQTNSHLDDPASFGQRLRSARSDAGLTLANVAFEGCTVGYLSHLEGGRRTPSLQVIRELARRLDVSETWLATGTGERSRAAADSPCLEADTALRFDDLEMAETLYAEALENARSPAALACARAGLGHLALRRDQPREAVAHYEAALDLDPAIDRDASFAESLGRAYARTGENELAIALFRKRLVLADEAADQLNRARFSVLLANALIDVSAFPEAATVLAGELGELDDSADPLFVARIHWSQSRLHAMRNEHDSAARFAQKAIDVLEATEFTQYRARAHHLLAFIEIDAGHAERALPLIERGRRLAGSAGGDLDRARFDLEEARALAQLGDVDRAAALAIDAAVVLKDQHPLDVGRAYAQLAATFASREEYENARSLYETALEFLDRTPSRPLAESLTAYGEVLEKLGDRDAAFDVYKRGAAVNAELARSISG